MKKVLLLLVVLSIALMACSPEPLAGKAIGDNVQRQQQEDVPRRDAPREIPPEISEEEMVDDMPEEMMEVPALGTTFTAVGASGTVLVSTDFGSTWSSIENGVKDLFAIHFEGSWGMTVGSSGAISQVRDGRVISMSSDAEFELHDVDFLNRNIGWAVGAGGLILKTTDSGSSWKSQIVPLTTPHLWGVDIIDEQHVVVVGNDGYILVTSDSGETWERVEVRPLGDLRAVQFVTDSIGWAVGANGVAFKTIDSGMSWERRDIGAGHLRGLHFLDEMNGYVVGVNGVILHTVDGGESWQEQDSRTRAVLWDIDFVNEARGCAVGISKAIVCTNDGGLTWERKTIEAPITLYGISSSEHFNSLTGNVVKKSSEQGVFWDWLDSYLGLS